jgi:uncharacterized protein YdaU (DUF1376 family)
LNYYERHLGDYARNTGHLTALEHGVYTLLLDAYYSREKPLPADVRECHRIAKAVSKVEKDAVTYVLREFFTESEEGYRQGRADKEIVRFNEKRRKASASANARWSGCEKDANALPTQSEGNALQSPDSNHQSKNHTPKPTKARTAISPDSPLDADVEEMHRQYVAHHVSKGTLMANWRAAWTTWLGNAERFGYPRRRTSNGGIHSGIRMS